MEDEVDQLLVRMQEAYTLRDARALASLYHPNARYLLPGGDTAQGPQAIEEHLPALFALVPEDVETEYISRNIDLVTSTLAIVDLRVQNYRKVGEAREPVSIEGFTFILLREANQWLIAGMRGALVPKE